MNYRLLSWTVYTLLLCLRLLFVFNLQSGYLHPDEYFQSIEIAAGDIYNLDVLRTWEFSLDDKGPLRSVAGMSPFVHIPILFTKWILDKLNSKTIPIHYNGSDLINRVLLPSRLITVLGSYLIDIFILRCCLHHQPRHERLLKLSRIQYILSIVRYHSVPTASLLYASCAFGGMLMSGRTIVNTWESIYVSLFGLLFLEIMKYLDQSSSFTLKKQSTTTIFMYIQSGLIVWSTFLRPTYILFILPLGIIELILLIMKCKVIFILLRLPVIVFVALFNVFICVLLDSIYFQNVSVLHPLQANVSQFQLICTPCRFFAYNSNPQHVSSHGLHPWFTHFLVNWPLILGPIFVIQLFTHPLQYRSLSSCVAWVCTVFPTLILSLIPHQEARFLIPCLPYACFVIGQSIDAKAKIRKRSHFSYMVVIFAILWSIHQLVLVIFYSHLHQAGLLSYMKTIPSNLTDECVKYVFFRTYMPPRFPLGIFRTQSSNSLIQSCKSLIDLGGSSISVLNSTINDLKVNQNFSGIIKLIYPGSQLPLEGFSVSSYGDLIEFEQFFPHLSMEYPPSILSAVKEFDSTQNYHTPQNTCTNRIPNHLQNGEPLHSNIPLPKLTPSPQIKIRSHLSSINNKPFITNTTNSTFQSSRLFPTPPLISSKSTTNDDVGGLRSNIPLPPILSDMVNNRKSNTEKNSTSVALRNDTSHTSIVTSQREYCTLANTNSESFTLKNLTIPICSDLNRIPANVPPLSSNPVSSSGLCSSRCLNHESLETAILNRTFCFVSSSDASKPPGKYARPTSIRRKLQPVTAPPVLSRDETTPTSTVQLPSGDGSIMQVKGSNTVDRRMNESGYIEDSCSVSNDTKKHSYRKRKTTQVLHQCLQTVPVSSPNVSSQIISTSDGSTSPLSVSVSNKSKPPETGLPNLNPSASTSYSPAKNSSHNNNNYNALSTSSTLKILLKKVTTAVGCDSTNRKHYFFEKRNIYKSTQQHSTYSATLSKSLHRRKQSFPMKMPSGSEQIQIPVFSPILHPYGYPIESVASSGNVDVMPTLSHESSNSSYKSASTLDDTDEENDLVFLGFTHIRTSRKRLQPSQFPETSSTAPSNARKAKRQRLHTSANHSSFRHEKLITSASIRKKSHKNTNVYSTAQSSFTTSHLSSLPNLSVTLERLTGFSESNRVDLPSLSVKLPTSKYSHGSSGQCVTPDECNNPLDSIIQNVQLEESSEISMEHSLLSTASSPLFEHSHNNKPNSTSDKHNNNSSESESQHTQILNSDDFSVMHSPSLTVNLPLLDFSAYSEQYIASDKPCESKNQLEIIASLNNFPTIHSSPNSLNLLSSKHSNHIEGNKTSNELKKPTELRKRREILTTLDDFSTLNSSKTGLNSDPSKKQLKQLSIPDELLTIQSRSEMDADEIQVDILTGELFIKNKPLRSLVMDLKRPRYYHLGLETKKSRLQPRGGRNQPYRNSKRQRHFSNSAKNMTITLVDKKILTSKTTTKTTTGKEKPVSGGSGGKRKKNESKNS
ncbi:unnamed protein product [Heterobilharzia americana]|nr:unnamed protein product [Heterobilharzia americana]